MHRTQPGMLRISTDEMPERDRVEIVREIYGRTIIKHDIEPLRDQPFRFEAQLYRLPQVGLALATLSPVEARRRQEHVEGDDLVLNISVRGGRVVRQRGRETAVSEGEAILTGAEPGLATIHSTSEIISVRLPRRVLVPLVSDLDAKLLKTIPRDSPALRLLIRYIRTAEEIGALATPNLHNAVAAHLCDLVSLSLGATRDAAETASRRGVRAARLQAIKRDIEDRLCRSDLSIGEMAARQGITPRYVARLFQHEGTSFTEFVLVRRLTRAHQNLCDTHSSGRRIADIAYACGFGDLSYFNRVFRLRFGLSPREARKLASLDECARAAE